MRASDDIVVTEATDLPVSVEEFKQHARIDYSTDDALVEHYVKAAAEHLRNLTGRAFLTETRKAVFPGWDAVLFLPTPLVRSVVAVTYVDEDFAEQTVDASLYHAAQLLAPWDQCQISPLTSWPGTPALVPNAVRVTYTCGYGAAAEDVPAGLRQAVLLLAAHWYEHREDVIVGTTASTVPNGVRALTEPHRFRRLF